MKPADLTTPTNLIPVPPTPLIINQNDPHTYIFWYYLHCPWTVGANQWCATEFDNSLEAPADQLADIGEGRFVTYITGT